MRQAVQAVYDDEIKVRRGGLDSFSSFLFFIAVGA
jgi:hypothetical protein